MKQRMNELMNYVCKLTASEKKQIIAQIMEMMHDPQNTNSQSVSCNEMVSAKRNLERPDCPHCKAEAERGMIVKRGFKKGVQRYSCKACGKIFVSTTNTAFQGTRKSSEAWCHFIDLTISGASLVICAEECGIAYQTAFNWRHKVLNVFRSFRDETKMAGRVEVDEMFIPLSYKGNHVKGSIGSKRIRLPGEENYLPRKSFQRGTDNRPTSHAERACVFCMVANANAFYGGVPGVGQITATMLDITLAKHVTKAQAKVLTDKNKVTVKYLKEKGYAYRSLASNVSDNSNNHRPEIVDGDHLQHVNVMHQQIRKFLRPYCGVASKYLDNYISLFVWLKNTQYVRRRKEVKNLSLSRASSYGTYIRSKDIYAFPAIPSCSVS